MKIELAEVVRAWEEQGIRFEEGQILMGEYMGQGLREPVFKFPVSLTDKKRVQLITHLSDKKVIPVLEGLTLR